MQRSLDLVGGVSPAVATRDGEAVARDGAPVVEVHQLDGSSQDGRVFEVRFADGLWMLATDADLEFM